MPTTNSEAAKIIEISNQYLTPQAAKELFVRLDDEVGKHTTNDSLKVSLAMMRSLVDPPRIVKYPKGEQAALYSLIVTHYCLVVGVALAFIVLPFAAPWYVALPCMTFIFFFTTNPVTCQLTKLENHMRQRLGMPRIGGFVGHYFMRPIQKLFGLITGNRV